MYSDIASLSTQLNNFANYDMGQVNARSLSGRLNRRIVHTRNDSGQNRDVIINMTIVIWEAIFRLAINIAIVTLPMGKLTTSQL